MCPHPIMLRSGLTGRINYSPIPCIYSVPIPFHLTKSIFNQAAWSLYCHYPPKSREITLITTLSSLILAVIDADDIDTNFECIECSLPVHFVTSSLRLKCRALLVVGSYVPIGRDQVILRHVTCFTVLQYAVKAP